MPDPLALLAAPAGFAAGGALALAAPRLLRRRALTERRVLTVASAGLAMLSAGEPTGLTAVDLAYKAAAGALVAYLGARADRRILLISAVIAFAAAWWSAILPLPLAAAGLALGVMLTTGRSPLTGAVVSIAVVQAALRLDLDPHGASSLAAVAACAPLVISGYRRTRSATRRTIRRTGAAVVAAVALATVAAGLTALMVQRPLQDAIDAAAEGLATARRGDAKASQRDFTLASNSFDDASRDLTSWWVTPGRLVPVISQHVNFAREVAAGGALLARTGATTTGAAEVDRLRVIDGAIDLAAVKALQAPLERAAGSAAEAKVRFTNADSDWLVPPVGDRLDRELARLTRAERDASRAAAVVDRLPSLLGGETPRRYFLLIQTPSESRALGGFIGSYGEILATNGRLELVKFGRTADLQTAGTPEERVLAAPDDYVARYSRFDPAVTWQNVTMSPDGPTVAQVVASLYPQSGGSPIDGVIAIDPAGLAALLRITGPVSVPPWPEPITADNAERILLHDQYIVLADRRNQEREEFLGDVAERVTRRLTTGSLPRPAELVDVLAPAAAAGGLTFNSLVPEDARLLDDLDLDKRFPGTGDDERVAVVTQNASGNKIDWFLHRSVTYDLDTSNDEVTLTVDLRNDAPASGLPGYIIGNALGPTVPLGTSRLYLSIYSPRRLTSATIDGKPALMESESELGVRVYSTYLNVLPGGTRRVVLALAGDVHGDLVVRHQPGRQDAVSVVVDGERAVGGPGRGIILKRDERYALPR